MNSDNHDFVKLYLFVSRTVRKLNFNGDLDMQLRLAFDQFQKIQKIVNQMDGKMDKESAYLIHLISELEILIHQFMDLERELREEMLGIVLNRVDSTDFADIETRDDLIYLEKSLEILNDKLLFIKFKVNRLAKKIFNWHQESGDEMI